MRTIRDTISLIRPCYTYCINFWSSTYRTNLKTQCTAEKRSVRTLFATAQQRHSRDIFINQKILPLYKLINQQEGTLANKGNQWHIPAERLPQSWRCYIGIKSNLDILVTWGYHYIQQHNLNSLLAIEPSIRGMAYQVTTRDLITLYFQE